MLEMVQDLLILNAQFTVFKLIVHQSSIWGHVVVEKPLSLRLNRLSNA